MPKARFSAEMKKIDVGSDVKMVLVIDDPDRVLPNVIPMRSKRVFVDLTTEQQHLEDMEDEDLPHHTPPPPAPQQLMFDQSRVHVPNVDEDGAAGEGATAPEPSPEEQTGPIEYECVGCHQRFGELTGSCANCGGTEFAEVPVEAVGEAETTEPPLWVTCTDCGGDGGTMENKCETCTGRGKVKNPELQEPAPEPQMVDCPDCGNLDPKRAHCQRCEGYGEVPAESIQQETAVTGGAD